MSATDSTWAAFNAQESRLVAQAQGARLDADYWKAACQQWQDKAQALEHAKASMAQQVEHEKAALHQRLDALKANNVALRLEIERLGAPEHADNAEAAAWRWATGNDTQTVAVCELDGPHWIPVLSSRAGLAAVAEEIRKRNYGPQWTAGSVLARMALGAERGE